VSWSAWAAMTNYRNLGDLNSKHLFLQFRGAGKSQSEVQADPRSVGFSFPGCMFWGGNVTDTEKEISCTSSFLFGGTGV
jgi:hypothetical protein